MSEYFCKFDKHLLVLTPNGEKQCTKCGNRFPIESNTILYNKQNLIDKQMMYIFKTAPLDHTITRVKKKCDNCGHDTHTVIRNKFLHKYYVCDNMDCGRVLKQHVN